MGVASVRPVASVALLVVFYDQKKTRARPNGLRFRSKTRGSDELVGDTRKGG